MLFFLGAAATARMASSTRHMPVFARAHQHSRSALSVTARHCTARCPNRLRSAVATSSAQTPPGDAVTTMAVTIRERLRGKGGGKVLLTLGDSVATLCLDNQASANAMTGPMGRRAQFGCTRHVVAAAGTTAKGCPLAPPVSDGLPAPRLSAFLRQAR